jgi:hypothetical protein
MSKATYPLKLPISAKEDGVSLNQWIASAVAQKVGAVETAAGFFRARAGGAEPEQLHSILALVPDREPRACRQLRPGGHLTRVFCAPVLTATRGRSAPVLANTRQLTRQATIDDTP